MKFFVMYVMNTMAVYGRTARQTCRPIVLLFYTYDGNGMRYQKIVNGVETEYYYNGTQLLVESRNGNRMYYIYGVTGIEGFEYGTGSYPETYYFDKNTLGDVVAIRDESGNILAKYEYDAWGNVTVCDQYGNEKTDVTFIGNINPIRYRGYYYDVETGFYYLQTRYYDPTICRFINSDNYELVAQLSSSIGQLNMYAYCGNNPIMCIDPTGQSWKSFWKGVGDWFTDHWEEVVIGTVFIIGGAIVSALTCGTGTTALAAFGTALLSSTIQVGTGIAVSVGINGLVNVVNGNNFFDNVGDTIANAYMWGGILSGGSQMVSGGFRKLKAKGFSGISNAKVGLLSPDKLYYKQAGMTIFRFGNPHGIRVALDFGKYGIHVHLFGEIHIWAIPGIVGAIEYFN